MSELIRVPDIGSGEGEVIELFVKVGDTVEADQSILTLESDKASMEIPAPKAGVVKSLKVKLGDRLKEGDELLELEIEGAAAAAPAPAAAAAPAPAEKPAAAAEAPAAPAAAPAAATIQDIHVPDIGSSGKAKIIELLVKVGDTVEADQSLITLSPTRPPWKSLRGCRRGGKHRGQAGRRSRHWRLHPQAESPRRCVGCCPGTGRCAGCQG